ncbi:hypothetical protein Q4S45_04445 [Massilia sp. R2A-15]|uniref:hypothetical protein n=1 Tax=Massilia sp. R2A-15 TaxID=3064278 RepID=UPI002736B03D|nr:hypothetical protein [Massilia sp. R2A-15]WLI90380.1 hypothetical protein Q4S45_04445 [Massilia sp. R2A-15]
MTTHRNFWFIAAFAAGCATIPASALAMGQAMGTNQGNGGALYSDLAPTTRPPAEFLARFVELTRADLGANAVMLAALDLEGDAGTAASQSAGFSVETTPGRIETTVGAAAAAHQKVMDRLAGGPVLSAEKQAAFAAGALSLAQAVKGYVELTGDLAAVKKSLSDAGAKGRLALYAAKTMPATVAQARQELQAAAQFAKSNNIALAPEVSQAAGTM